MKQYDAIIIGGGPAGLTAGIYLMRSGIRTLLIEKLFTGGQIATTPMLENFPGFPLGIPGPDFAMALHDQAQNLGLEIAFDEVKSLELQRQPKIVATAFDTYEAKTIICCMGAEPKTLGLPKEDILRGAGISYCATCDGAFFRDKEVAVIGGGDTACEDALYLSKLAKKVHIIHRRDKLRATAQLQRQVMQDPKIEIHWDSQVEELEGDKGLSALRLRGQGGEPQSLAVDGAFVAIGTDPQNSLVQGQLQLSKEGYIITDEYMRTNVQGVFAAGDIRTTVLRQVVTAAADGAIAAMSIAALLA